MHILENCPVYKYNRKKFFGNKFLTEHFCIEILKGKFGWNKLAKYLSEVISLKNLLLQEAGDFN